MNLLIIDINPDLRAALLSIYMILCFSISYRSYYLLIFGLKSSVIIDVKTYDIGEKCVSPLMRFFLKCSFNKKEFNPYFAPESIEDISDSTFIMFHMNFIFFIVSLATLVSYNVLLFVFYGNVPTLFVIIFGIYLFLLLLYLITMKIIIVIGNKVNKVEVDIPRPKNITRF